MDSPGELDSSGDLQSGNSRDYGSAEAGRSPWDLSDLIVVLPGRRACRRLLGHLAFRASAEQAILNPPEVCTPGALPEKLYQPQQPFASPIVQRMAWVAALRSLRRTAAHVIGEMPADEDFKSWLDYCDLFRRTHIELAGEGYDFSEVIIRGQKIPNFGEAETWKFLCRLQKKYLELLEQENSSDEQTARRLAVDQHSCHTTSRIILAGVVDLNRTLQMMLDQVAPRVTSLVFAPAELADRFDHYGCLNPGYWEEATLDIPAGLVSVVDGPEDMASAVVASLSDWSQDLAAHEIEIAVADPNLVDEIQQQTRRFMIGTHWAGGLALRQTPVFQLVLEVAAYLDGRRFVEFASLLRHPHVGRWLDATLDLGTLPEQQAPDSKPAAPAADLLTELDRYFNNHLQPRLGDWLGKPEEHFQIKAAHEALQRWLAPLEKPRTRNLGQWATVLTQVLSEVYNAIPLTQDASSELCAASLLVFREKLSDLANVAPRLTPQVTSREAINMLLDLVAGESIPLAAEAGDVEINGWLETAMDGTPAKIITSVNEGYLPQSLNSDMLLPNSIRKRLRLDDNQKRYARDAYLLSWIQANTQSNCN